MKPDLVVWVKVGVAVGVKVGGKGVKSVFFIRTPRESLQIGLKSCL